MVTDDPFSERVEALLKQMTLQEKIGQLNLRSADMSTTGPTTAREADIIAGIKSGDIGTLFNAFTVNYTRAMQEYAMNNTRLQIPLFFGFDVIHGYRTIFPVPIAEASSWDLDAISQSTRIQATEAAAGGLHWTFAPMVDIARDPRWGRVVEGAGEDPYLGSLIAAARVRGIQGQVTPNTTYGIDELMGCVKHFAVYGAVQSGRDYNTVDESEMTIRETYLPPYKATVDAGVASVMTAFNELNGVPSTANRWLLQKILRQEWGFTGFVVTDYTAVMELTRHGIACDEAGASLAAKNAGVDLDMESNYYHDQLENLVNQGRISMDSIDDSVRLILRAKFQLGLFDDPFRYCDEEREKNATLNPAFLAAAQALAEKSMVLLRNEPYAGVGAKALPLPTTATSIALIGPLADSAWDVMGPWAGWGHPEDSITLKQGIAARMPKADLILAQGCDVNGFSTDGFQQALDAAKTVDVVVLAMGESADMSGEASSRSDIRLPGVQEELILQVCAAAKGKPVVLVLMNGRPLDLSAVVSTVPAILETWFLGSMAGPAIANVLFGDVNPSGKLPMTFPRRVGQVPIYYNHKNTGRPWRPEAGKYCSQYLDVDNSPLFPFGWGLSYNLYEYSDLQLTVQPAGNASFQSVTATATVTNTGAYQGREVVQLYVRDETASTTRPVKELKGFQSVYLAPGASQTVTFTLTRDDLSFHTYDDSFAIVKTFEPGHFQVFVGGDSMNLLASRFLAY